MYNESDDDPWVEVIRPHENRALLDALQNNNLSIVQQIDKDYPRALNSSMDIHETWAIHIASENDSFEIIEYLLTRFPAQLNQMNKAGQTPLYFSASKGYARTVQYLVDKKADLYREVDYQNHETHGLTAIIKAMHCGHHQVVNILLIAEALTPQQMRCHKKYQIALKWGLEQKHDTLVKWLLKISTFNALKLKVQAALMSTAVQQHSLEVIRLLVSRNPKLLVQPDDHGAPPILWAARRGDVSIIQYLIEEGVSVDIVIDQPNHRDHGKNLITLANERKHFEAANLMIHTLLTIYNQYTIFDFITDGETALEYMLLNPINARLIFNNLRIMDLIKNSGVNVTSKSIGYYITARSRRPSFFVEIDGKTGMADVFEPDCLLEEGTHSTVRRFSNLAHDKQVAVKSPKENWTPGELSGEVQKVPEIQDTTIHSFHIKRLNFFGQREFTLRSVMPYVGSVPGSQLSADIQSNQDFELQFSDSPEFF